MSQNKSLIFCTQDMADLPDPVPGSGENKLEHSYSLWFTQRTRGSVSNTNSYEENIKFVGSFCTVSLRIYILSAFLSDLVNIQLHCTLFVLPILLLLSACLYRIAGIFRGAKFS